jgi:hypothetical protein
MTTSASNEPGHVTIASETPYWAEFSRLLQRGVFCPIAARCSVQDYLTRQLGIDPDYVRDRIATVFVDGSVVDDLETTTLRPGSALTLSAASTPLCGRRSAGRAMMRRAGRSMDHRTRSGSSCSTRSSRRSARRCCGAASSSIARRRRAPWEPGAAT